ncbi:hypothetical protein [Demequina sp. NBRC 110056]|uniref:hypothetical protein n=1 Tax=Demequina sp. NBRC 110056 TaxID=1570345 RepID=UPI0009FE5580|nr:hypothetical protein [Demequina sp. NBRC 110056]
MTGGPDLPGSGGAGPVVLRHKDATRQAVLYGAFSALVVVVILGVMWLGAPGRWWTLVLAPVALFGAYSAVRLATLKVRLDERGIWEPNPFRLTYLTPWSDVRRMDPTTIDGRVRFATVRITHADGSSHDVAALHVQSGAAYAKPAVDGWVRAMRDAKARWS